MGESPEKRCERSELEEEMAEDRKRGLDGKEGGRRVRKQRFGVREQLKESTTDELNAF